MYEKQNEEYFYRCWGEQGREIYQMFVRNLELEKNRIKRKDSNLS